MFQHIGLLCKCEGHFCRTCEQWKCHRAFYKNPKGVNGLGSRCKECYQQVYRDRKNAPPIENIEIPVFQHIGLFCGCEGKFCRTCEQWKCHRAFSKDHKGGKGLSSACKACIKSYQLTHRDEINKQRRENAREKADHYNAYNKEYNRKNPEMKRASDQKYRRENAEYFRAYHKAYWDKLRDDDEYMAKKREHHREYIKLHPEKSAQHFNNRRARLEQASGSFTSREWKKLCKHYNYTCLCCGKCEPKIKLTVDHVVPLSMGGTNFIENIQPLCQSCNSRKGTTVVDYRVNWS